jgi:hypothetical protein
MKTRGPCVADGRLRTTGGATKYGCRLANHAAAVPVRA